VSDIDLLADARAWLATQGGRVQTHSEICHRWHPACLVSRLLSRAGQTEAKARDFDSDCPERDTDHDAAPAAIACGSDRPDNPAPLPAGTGDTPHRLRLTDAEREAIAFMLRHAAVAADDEAFADSADYRVHHDAVFGLLDRTHADGNRH